MKFSVYELSFSAATWLVLLLEIVQYHLAEITSQFDR